MNYAEDTSFQTENVKGAGPRYPAPTRLNLVPAVHHGEMSFVSYDTLQRYLLDIAPYRPLTRKEEKELAIKVRQKGDQKAAHTLITSNLRLVVKIAIAFQRYWTEKLLDLIQEGNFGLLQAVRKFDPYRGIKFSYYSSFWIKAYMLKFIMENWRLVKIGSTKDQRKLFFNLNKEKDHLIAQGVTPEPGLLAERLCVKEEKIVEMNQILGGFEISLDAPVGEDSREAHGVGLLDSSIDIDRQLYKQQRQRIVAQNLKEFRKTLCGKEADIFDNRIMAEEPLTLQLLGDRYGISRQRVHQIEEKIIRNAKKWLIKTIPNFEENYSDYL